MAEREITDDCGTCVDYSYSADIESLIEDYAFILCDELTESDVRLYCEFQEALHREQMLENKLATLQRLVANTQEASESGWQVSVASPPHHRDLIIL